MSEHERNTPERRTSLHFIVRIPTPELLRARHADDLRAGRIVVRTSKVLPAGAAIEVTLFPPGGSDPLLLPGTVEAAIDLDGGAARGLSVRLGQLSEETRTRLDALLDDAAPSASSPTSATELERSRAEVSRLERELEHFKILLEHGRIEREEMSRSLETALRKSAAKKQDFDALVEKNRSLESIVRGLSGEAPLPSDAAVPRDSAHIRERLAEADQKVASLRQELATLQASDAANRQQLAELETKRADLEERRHREVGRLATELAKSARKIAALEARVAAPAMSDGAVDPVRLELDEARIELEKFRQESWKAQSEKREVETELANSRAAFAPLQQSEGSARRLVERLAEEKAALDRAHRAEVTKIEAAVDRIRQANEEERIRAKRESDTLRAKNRELEEQLARLSESPGGASRVDPGESVRRDSGSFPRPSFEGAPTPAGMRPPSGGLEAPLAPALSIGSQDEMLLQLRQGARIRRTEKFRRFEPVSPAETRLSSWLEMHDQLGSLAAAASGQLAEEQLAKLLYLFHRRGIIELVG